MTKLADYKYSGFYVAKDLEGAVRLYEKAAKGGDPQAMINLSLVLEKNLIKPTKGSSPDYIKHLQK
jgi:TPR repeat protein